MSTFTFASVFGEGGFGESADITHGVAGRGLMLMYNIRPAALQIAVVTAQMDRTSGITGMLERVGTVTVRPGVG